MILLSRYPFALKFVNGLITGGNRINGNTIIAKSIYIGSHESL